MCVLSCQDKMIFHPSKSKVLSEPFPYKFSLSHAWSTLSGYTEANHICFTLPSLHNTKVVNPKAWLGYRNIFFRVLAHWRIITHTRLCITGKIRCSGKICVQKTKPNLKASEQRKKKITPVKMSATDWLCILQAVMKSKLHRKAMKQ